MFARWEIVGLCALGLGFLLGIGVAASCNVSYTQASGLALSFHGSGREAGCR